MRWPGRRGGRLASLGQDYGEAHRRYVERLPRSNALWLRTKPFGVPPGHELGECLRTFAHIVERLGLGVRAQVLDVGCGPGWLSEFLARCGYWVVGVDVSEDMVKIARERVEAIAEPIADGLDALAELHATPVLELPWTSRFDAAILYDAMHHFDDEVETLRVVRRALAPGGRIFIHEGVRPEPGSEGERELVAEMEEYGTLESPFDPDYLVDVVRKAGFEQVARFAAVDRLLDLSATGEELQRVQALVEAPPMNTVVAAAPQAGAAEGFSARLEPAGQVVSDDGAFTVPVRITNVGSCYWPAALDSRRPPGVVTVGPYLPVEDDLRVELPRLPLPHPVSHGESVEVAVRVPRAEAEGRSEVAIDLVREGIAWFADYGSAPLVVRLPAEG